MELEHAPLEQLRTAIANSDAQAVDVCLDKLSPAESSHAVVNLSDDDQTRLLSMLSDEDAAEIVETL
ncbi:MAG: hypothetical protein HYV60_18110, partial [Planctomycetia bacterium]|nr:hypothetical protein [Planctomycetia bacterium]